MKKLLYTKVGTNLHRIIVGILEIVNGLFHILSIGFYKGSIPSDYSLHCLRKNVENNNNQK